MIIKTAEENAVMIRPQIHDDNAPGRCYLLLRNVAEWMPKNGILSGERAATVCPSDGTNGGRRSAFFEWQQ
jgi:hypothetical protein